MALGPAAQSALIQWVVHSPDSKSLLLGIADADLFQGEYIPARLQGRVRGGLERWLCLV
jgi:hypothetical protein